MGLPMEAWESYDEPYKQTYPEYVNVQREKDAGAYSVKAALERSRMYENADPGWLSVMKAALRRDRAWRVLGVHAPRPAWPASARRRACATWRRSG